MKLKQEKIIKTVEEVSQWIEITESEEKSLGIEKRLRNLGAIPPNAEFSKQLKITIIDESWANSYVLFSGWLKIVPDSKSD